MKLVSTKDVHQDGVKVLVYAVAGAGKTTLIATAPDPIIISAESGLLALAEHDIPAIEITTEKDLKEAYEYVKKSEYKTVCLDSVSDIAEAILIEQKANFSDGRQAYGKLNDIMGKYIRLFRNLKGKNVYFTAKEAKIEVNGVNVIQPSMPGQSLTVNLPYYFDLVMRLEVDKSGKRQLTTKAAITIVRKDRSGRLGDKEPADLGKIFEKAAPPQRLTKAETQSESDSTENVSNG